MTAIQPSQAIFVGSSPSFTCVAEFDDTVDVPLVVSIVAFADQQIIRSDYSVQAEGYRRYTRTFTIKNVQPNLEYVCVFSPPYSELSASYILMDQNNSMASVHVFVDISISK